MHESNEKKIFFSVLWFYLIGALIFFISLLSLGRIYLPNPVWLMFLLLTVGFLVFIFIPFPGKGIPGQGGWRRGWYPRTLEQILEGEATGGEGLRPAVQTVAPVPLLPLVLLLIAVVLSAPMEMSEVRWRTEQAGKLSSIYESATGDVTELELLAQELGTAVVDLVSGQSMGEERSGERSRLFYSLDSLAGSIDRRLVPFEEIGIQLFSQRGHLIAWGGRPLYRKTTWTGPGSARVFTSRTTLYELLVEVVPLPRGGWVVVDIPLEVNYRISNKYLKSVTLGDVLSERYGAEIRFNFSMGEHGGEIRWRDSGLADTLRQVTAAPGGAIQIHGYVQSRAAQPIARLIVSGKEYAIDRKDQERRRVFWAGLDLTLAVLVIGIWTYRLYFKRRRTEIPRPWKMLVRIVAFAAFLFLIRFVLLKLDVPRDILRTSLFDPALFADAGFPAGLTKTAGDFLITSLFALVLVFGAIKIFRTYYSGVLERSLAARRYRPAVLAAKAAFLFFLSAASVIIVRAIVTRVVLNANPRLIGLDVNFLDPPVLILHLALLFIVSAVCIAAIFLIRLVLLWRGGGFVEGAIASLLAFGGIAVAVGPEPLLLLGTCGLLILAIKVFPLVRKEDIISVIFSSFFLVLICTIFIYSTAAERYLELGKSRVLERAQDFNYPEDSWLQLVLFDVCQEIAQDRSIASKVRTERESAAFEVWAESSLSGYYLSCVFDIYDAAGELISSFSVGTPYEHPPFAQEEDLDAEGVIVEQITQGTKDGAIYSFKGIAAVTSIRGERIGRVEITIPYFFENPELLSRSGPVAPEILHNIERGSVAPRIDEPEDLLVARMNGDIVVDSSAPELFAGSAIEEGADRWFMLDIGREKYHCIVKLREDERGFLIGFRSRGFLEELLKWATIVSIDVILMILSLFVTLLIHRLPLVRSVTPAFSLRGGLGFRQKVLLSFLFVSIVPVVILGAFSSQFIEQSYRAEGKREALDNGRSAVSLVAHSIASEAESFSGSQYLRDILSGDAGARIRDVALYEKMQFTLFDGDGNLLLDESLSDFDSVEVAKIIGAAGSGMVLVLYDYPHLYGGVTIPVALAGRPGGHLFYRRRIDDEFADGIADVMGVNVNVYYAGVVRASSQRELFMGGFLDPLLDPIVYADIALLRSRATVRDESLGEYSFQVASMPLPQLRGIEAAVLSIPLLYQPVLVRQEILKTSALIMGLLALLFAATVTIGIFLAGKIFNPIVELQAGTRRIIQGDLEFKLEADAMDELGELVASFNTMTEALREARRNLLERQRYLTAVLDSVATGVITADGGGRIMTINAAGERILEISGAEIQGKGVDELERLGLNSLYELSAADDRPVRERELNIFSGERKRTLKAVVTSLVEGGENLGTVVVFDDLTELIRSKKLAAWVEMARQIAHEVKNPLTPIRLSAQLMRRAHEAKAEDFDEIFNSGVETVIQQTEILRRIASEFSSFGRVTNLAPEAIPVVKFIEDFITAYRGADKVRIIIEPSGGGCCLADRESLRKILVNLVENALEAMQHEGAITIATEEREGYVYISVIDSGPGLSPEAEERLFEPYFSTKTNGTGLGLAISQSLAHEMDGEIRIRNRAEGGGTEATLKLPLASHSPRA